MRKAVLLLNLGSPASPSPADVRAFLREFLSDGRVIDLPWPLRKALLELVILPFRPRKSAEAYSRVWTPEGSPLIAMSQRQMDALQVRIDLPVHLAMRYGTPALAPTLREIAKSGAERIFLVPLFPHYAMASYETAVARVTELLHQTNSTLRVDAMQPFYSEPGYIDALVASAKPFLGDGFQHLLFSFHGIPERQVKKSDPSHSHCLTATDCCHAAHPCQSTCYRHQCIRTAEFFARRAGLSSGQSSISFQSRLGNGKWLSPYTFDALRHFGENKLGTLLVMAPSFVTDCLETLGELSQDGRRIFTEAGGREMVYIPCLNDSRLFMDFLAAKVREWEENLA